MKNLGLYIHIPFCVQKCPYCNFYSVRADELLMDSYVNALISHINAWGSRVSYKVDSIYFGGGTPSILGARRLSRVLEEINKCFNLDSPEITVEVNPATVTDSYFNDLISEGVNRVSIGSQSFNDNELKALGRLHDTKDIITTVEQAKTAGFKNISLDLMLAIEKQTEKSLIHSINMCKELDVSHVSSYILKIEPNTPFFNKKEEILKGEEVQGNLYLTCVSHLEENGFFQYEISNFSKIGQESRHNLKYWNREDYLGLGPAAHSYCDAVQIFDLGNSTHARLPREARPAHPNVLGEGERLEATAQDRKRFFSPDNLNTFLDSSNTPFNFYIDDQNINEKSEELMLSLRLKTGIDIDKLPQEKIEKLKNAKLAEVKNNRLSLTPKGFLVSNSIINFLDE